MGLRKLYTTQSLSDVIWHYLVYLEARLLHDPNARDLAPQVTKLVNEVEAAWLGQRSKWRSVIVAQALVDYINYLLDRNTTRFSRTLLNQDSIDQDTAHPRYKRYFPISLSRVIRLALGAQIQVTRPWLSSIATEAEEAVRAFVSLFTDNLKEGDSALRSLEDATAARKDFRTRDINDLVAHINDVCQEIYGVLISRAPGLRLTVDWADNFFYTPRNASGPQDPAALYQEALYHVFAARGLEVSDAVDTKIQETTDIKLLSAWVAKSPTAATPEEAVGLPAPTPA